MCVTSHSVKVDCGGACSSPSFLDYIALCSPVYFTRATITYSFSSLLELWMHLRAAAHPRGLNSAFTSQCQLEETASYSVITSQPVLFLHLPRSRLFDSGHICAMCLGGFFLSLWCRAVIRAWLSRAFIFLVPFYPPSFHTVYST
jgi:hypothetical protein